jgi:type IV pilus assembly protein PilV
MTRQHNSKGFSLLEVLVTLVILSVGLLGLAGLQAQGLRFNHFAYMRGQTSALAYAMSDRMRANRFAIVSATGNYVGFYNEKDTLGNYPTTQLNGCTQTTPSGTAANCTIVQMAAHDRAEWDAELGLFLAQGQGQVCVDATPDSLVCDNMCIHPVENTAVACTAAGLIIPFVITVRWDEGDGGSATGLGCDPDVATDLKCFQTNFQVTP